MRILIVGGTSFVGRHITEHALAAGHEVTLFNRGQTNAGAFSQVSHVQGDRNQGIAGLAGLEGKQFDATIDVCAYVPARVRDLLGVLGGGVGHYTFISTISVYPDDTPAGFDESAHLLAPSYGDELRMEDYGALKVGCEQAAVEILGNGVCIVRPGYVIGPHDPTGRFTYWVERVARAAGGSMLGGAAEQPLQAIDGRDLASFTLGLVESQDSGGFNATAPDPAPTFDSVLRQVADGVGAPFPAVEWLGKEHDLLPLTQAPESYGLMQADLAKGRRHGLAWRPLAASARDLLEWVTRSRADGSYDARGRSLSAADEAALLASGPQA
ncbi:MAG: NAD-dependent epimerase/dehydratase family protein [Acidimicrobiales bacterium]